MCVLAPVGAAVSVVEELPSLLAEGRRRVELQVGNALFVGRFVVNQKQRELTARLEGLLGNNAHRETPEPHDAAAETAPPGPGPQRSAPDPAAAAIVDGTLADYDTLSASQVVRRLESLGSEELPRSSATRLPPATAGRFSTGPVSCSTSGPPARLALNAVELARQARAEDRQACTRLLSQALVAAESMRGGAALVGDATTVTLLERWTQPGDAANLLVGEFEGAVVGLLAATASGGPRGASRAA